MAHIFGRDHTGAELLRVVGDMSQLPGRALGIAAAASRVAGRVPAPG